MNAVALSFTESNVDVEGRLPGASVMKMAGQRPTTVQIDLPITTATSCG